MSAGSHRRATRLFLLVALALAGGVGCNGSLGPAADPGGPGQAGTTAGGSTGVSTGVGGSTGAAGSGVPGPGTAGVGAATGAAGTGAGTAGTGAAGVTGAAGINGAAGVNGAGGSTGAAGSGAAGTGGPGCRALLYGVIVTSSEAPTSLLSAVTGLEVGSTLRVRAMAEGYSGDLDWVWTVSLGGQKFTPTTFRDATFSEFDLQVDRPGLLAITATIKNAPMCRAATPPPLTIKEPSAPSFVFRITPPSGSRLPTRDLRLPAAEVEGKSHTLDLGPGGAGQVLSISPIDGRGEPLPSFVRVTGPSFGFDLNGYTGAGPLVTTLALGLTYEVLVVPDGGLAPLLVTGGGAPQYFDARMTVLPGVPVHGDARDGRGLPVAGARILLRDGKRPSTIGVTGANGAFALETREGQLSALIVPPAGSGLPEAHVAAAPGIVLVPGVGSLELAMTWAASGVSTPLDVTVHAGGVAVAGARVRAETVAELPSVGQIRVRPAGVVGATDMYFPATGTARADAVTDAQGVARLGLLPVAKYHVTVAPPAGSPSAITTADVDLRAPGSPLAVTLASSVKVVGTLTPTAAGAGARVTALDAGVLAPPSPATAIAKATGEYDLTLSPGRKYTLLVEPSGGLRWRRVVLAQRSAASAWEDTLPASLSWTGAVMGGDRRVAGALVQVFCVAPPASCVDPTTAVSEGITRADGTLDLTLPKYAP